MQLILAEELGVYGQEEQKVGIGTLPRKSGGGGRRAFSLAKTSSRAEKNRGHSHDDENGEHKQNHRCLPPLP
jgi:hypothetical protein